MAGFLPQLLGVLVALVLGSYGFTWVIYRTLMGELSLLRDHVENHQAHKIKELEARLRDLEQRG